jgi:hypothetical protein
MLYSRIEGTGKPVLIHGFRNVRQLKSFGALYAAEGFQTHILI